MRQLDSQMPLKVELKVELCLHKLKKSAKKCIQQSGKTKITIQYVGET